MDYGTIGLATTLLTVALSGITFFFSGFVVYLHAKAVRRGAPRLPRHILAMAVAYNGLVVSLLTAERDFQVRFWVYGPCLVLGVYGLAVMSRAQRKRSLAGPHSPTRKA